jgi:uncharacterized protein (DUF1499 family)
LVALALILAVVGLLSLISASLGYRLALWSVAAAFVALRVSVYIAMGAAVVGLISVVAALAAHHWGLLAGAVLAIVLAGTAAAVPLGMQRISRSVPPIHDITTDLEHPPEFVALRALRERAPNGAQYGGGAVAAAQRSAYPDVRPLLLSIPPDRAFSLVEATAKDQGWEIAAAVPAEGRLEATDTTRWFRFKDDIVVRVAPAPNGSRVDVRSVSRIGRGDLGTNARRIRAFLAALSARG